MKILLDARMVRHPLDGFGAYTRMLAEVLSEENEIELKLLVHDSTDLDVLPNVPKVESDVSFLGFGELTGALAQTIHSANVDAFLSPTFAVIRGLKLPYGVIVHDLIHLRYGGLGQRLYYKFLLKPFLKKARSIATVSQTSKQELQKWIGEASISILPNVFSFPESDDEPIERKREILMLTNPKPHKNANCVFKAWAEVQSLGTLKDWVLVSNIEPSEPLSHFKDLGRLSHDELQEKLKNVSVVMFPSLEEGFGRPPIEGFLSGAEVMVSDIPVHRENFSSVRTGVTYLNPNQVSVWVEALLRLDDLEGVRFPVAEDRKKLAERFSKSVLQERLREWLKEFEPQ